MNPRFTNKVNGEFVVVVRGDLGSHSVRLARGSLRSSDLPRISLETRDPWFPVSSFDGSVIAFSGHPYKTIRQMPTDGNRDDEEVFTAMPPVTEAFPLSFSPDNKALLAVERLPLDEFQLIVLDLQKEPPVRHLIDRVGTKEHYGVFSPNGKWIAYVSDQEGEAQVFLRKYVKEDHRVEPEKMVSREGGWWPVWNGDDEILFLDKDARMLKSVSFKEGVPGLPIDKLDLSELELPQPGWILVARPYDVNPDGKLLMIAREKDRRQMQVHVEQNWFQELERLMKQ
jgi:Tol biopolymer transport system component